ncbi:N-acyl homoserine lactonase family protein [Nonomuraea sp. SYSU D8015]|uniref:N-acyl homoserine lactonase family protein n=1 Tax=Nonomuraea sp. SYSU D8015 TaxID=2593644 RepID=UPI0016611FDE|nr:N-acyl homoserine lactonase family protein [Nonomuraea sp. SYSU D8015]
MKLLGKIALLALTLVVSAAWLVVLRLKDVAAPLLVGYGLLLLGLMIGLLWPGVFGRRSGRARVRALVGVPAALCTLGLYFAVVFHVTDVPVLIGLAAAATLAAALVTGLRRRRARTEPASGRARRALLLAGAGALLGVLSGISTSRVDRYRRDLLARGAEEREQAVNATGGRRRISDGAVRVFPIHTGDTIVTYGQFYGGLDGWEGLNGYMRTLLDKAQIAVPIYAYLIDHPRHGLMLIDAGVNWEQAHDHDGYYGHDGMASRLLTERNEYKMTPEQDLQVQVARLGYDIKEISTVFLTHVHDDHAGGLRYLSHATVVMDRRDWIDGVLYPYSFGLVKDRLSFPAFDSGRYGAFPAAQDHFGDGSLVLLPTPGHSPGHMCVLLRMDDGAALFMGDTLYTLPHLAVDQVRQMTIGGADTELQLQAARRIQSLLASAQDTVPLFAHDNTPYRSAVASVFSNGRPRAAEFRTLRRHLDTVLTPDWRLRPGHTPRFVPPSSGAGIGEVDFR